jgi:hypothetical protein
VWVQEIHHSKHVNHGFWLWLKLESAVRGQGPTGRVARDDISIEIDGRLPKERREVRPTPSQSVDAILDDIGETDVRDEAVGDGNDVVAVLLEGRDDPGVSAA